MDKKDPEPLTRGQQAVVAVLGFGLGAVFLAVCYRAVMWILGVD